MVLSIAISSTSLKVPLSFGLVYFNFSVKIFLLSLESFIHDVISVIGGKKSAIFIL